MVERGVPGCSRYCKNCKQDCLCDTCGYCHSCNPSAVINNYGNHRWIHQSCNGKKPSGSNSDRSSITDFLVDAFERFSRFFETEIFTIEIGDNKKYYVHKEALSSASAVLKKQITSEMKESKTKTIRLDDLTDSEAVFNVFLQYSYFGGYGYDEKGKEDALILHASVYVFAEKIEALELKTLALKNATKLCSSSASSNPGLLKVIQFSIPEAVSIIYEGTYDSKTGRLPSSLVSSGDKDSIKISAFTRDGFRMLLAKFCAAFVDELRGNESFISTLEKYPSFSTDVLIFTGKGSAFSTDGEGNLLL